MRYKIIVVGVLLSIILGSWAIIAAVGGADGNVVVSYKGAQKNSGVPLAGLTAVAAGATLKANKHAGHPGHIAALSATGDLDDGGTLGTIAKKATGDYVATGSTAYEPLFGATNKVSKVAYTAKGDLLVGSTAATPSALAGATNNYVLTRDSAAALGVKWAATQGDTLKANKSSIGAASGIASLNAGSLVVENPANATATPTASKIPIADANGVLHWDWLPANHYQYYGRNLSEDFIMNPSTAGNNNAWSPLAVASGTELMASVIGGTMYSGYNATTMAAHPGTILLKSSASANSGFAFYFTADNYDNFILAGNETTELIFLVATTSNLKMRFGYAPSIHVSTAPVTGIWESLDGSTLTCMAGDGATVKTGTSYVVSANTWYRARIATNSDVSRVDCYLYASPGAELWTDNLTTHLPNTATKGVNHGVIAFQTTGATAILIYIDYINFQINRVLNR